MRFRDAYRRVLNRVLPFETEHRVIVEVKASDLELLRRGVGAYVLGKVVQGVAEQGVKELFKAYEKTHPRPRRIVE